MFLQNLRPVVHRSGVSVVWRIGLRCPVRGIAHLDPGVGNAMMRLRSVGRKWTALCVLGAFVAGGGTAYGDAISGIVSFGDSLSDVGNYYAATGGAVPPASYGYDPGRFTNGPNWVEYLARDLGVAVPTASLKGGTDYAYGGATTGTGTTSSTFLARPRPFRISASRSPRTWLPTRRQRASSTRSGVAPTISSTPARPTR